MFTTMKHAQGKQSAVLWGPCAREGAAQCSVSAHAHTHTGSSRERAGMQGQGQGLSVRKWDALKGEIPTVCFCVCACVSVRAVCGDLSSRLIAAGSTK